MRCVNENREVTTGIDHYLPEEPLVESHVWGRSTQLVETRVCTTHAAEPEDVNHTCEGFEVRLERACAVNFWTGEHTGPGPDTELVIRRIRSRLKEPEPFDEPRCDVETGPVGPALRLHAQEGFDLLRVLTRALKLAREQGLIAERLRLSERVRRETNDWEDNADLIAAMGVLPPPVDEEEEFEELARRNGLAPAKRKSARRPAPRRITKKRGKSSRRPSGRKERRERPVSPESPEEQHGI
jgi:hypothetical protein